MPGRDADLAEPRRRIDHPGHAVMDFAFRGYDVYVDGCHVLYWNFFAFSTASSIVPTM